MSAETDIGPLLEKLTGQRAPIAASVPKHIEELLGPGGAGLGYSQLNELLLSFGYDRITHEFFQYLVDETIDYTTSSAIESVVDLKRGILRFLKIALLRYGNVKFAFKKLSSDPLELEALLDSLAPLDELDFSSRHRPVHNIEEIPGAETFYLGYVVEDELRSQLEKNPANQDLQREEELRQAIVTRGRKNHEAYLLSDHLDVYVATSMRERHEYLMVNQEVSDIFSQPSLKPLQLRWFDPTQAYCQDRIDKGLVEALMLKRAKCTIYLAQESDTFGKDSELASTLAQGKPVIALVPQASEEYAERFIVAMKDAYPGEDERSLLLRQLRFFEPSSAWTEKQVRDWLTSPQAADREKVRARFVRAMKKRYDSRAKILREIHPLGLQVNLETGVANGVLVVRTAEDCAKLVRRVVTRSLAFELDEKRGGDQGYLFLREEISGSIFRVMSGDPLLTNSFWNFYLKS